MSCTDSHERSAPSCSLRRCLPSKTTPFLGGLLTCSGMLIATGQTRCPMSLGGDQQDETRLFRSCSERRSCHCLRTREVQGCSHMEEQSGHHFPAPVCSSPSSGCGSRAPSSSSPSSSSSCKEHRERRPAAARWRQRIRNGRRDRDRDRAQGRDRDQERDRVSRVPGPTRSPEKPLHVSTVNS